MKTIVEFVRKQAYGRCQYIGEMSRLIRTHNWNYQTVGPEVTPAQARQILNFWKPDGCVVNNDALPVDLTKGIPTVFTHRDLKTLPRNAVLVSYDEHKIGEEAARELLQLGLCHYAFVPDSEQSYWNVKREAGFLAAMQVNLKGVFEFSAKEKSWRKKGGRTYMLSEWLSSLPHPLGVFAANDEVACEVVSACRHAGLRIPDDVAIVGVDNDEAICEGQSPTLTSIAFSETVMTDRIFEALEKLMTGEALSSRRFLVTYVCVVRRMSTMRLQNSDPEIVAALDLIRQRACLGLTAADVAATIRGGRCQAQRRFKEATGRTIVRALVEARLSRARELLKDKSISRTFVANQCGYSSWVPLYLQLRKEGRQGL